MEVKRGFKVTDAGVIPEDWTSTDLADFCTLQRGFDITESTRVSGHVPVFSSSGLAYYHNRAMVSPPGVVTGRKGILGKVFLIDEPFWPHDTTLWVKDFRGNFAEFVAVVLENFHLERLDAATSVPTLNRNNLAGHFVAVPPSLDEQHAITDALRDADGLIASLEQLLAKKRLIKQGAMQQLLTGMKRLPGFSGEWQSRKLGTLGPFLKGSGVRKDEASSGDLPCVRYGELYTRHNDCIKQFFSFISKSVASTAKRLRCGDLLFAGSGETKEEIGKCIAFVHDCEAYAGGDIVILRPENVDSRFMGYYLNTRPIRFQKASRGQGDAVVHISSASLAEIDVIIPLVEEQSAIGSILADMDADIATVNDKLAKACGIKQGMMQELLTGRIRLR